MRGSAAPFPQPGLEPPAVYPIADLVTLAAARRGAVTPERESGSAVLSSAVEELVDHGAGWIQVRAKGLVDRELFAELKRCCRIVSGHPVALWINDRADLAAMLPVSGVHLGQDDLPPGEVRRIVGDRVWIGRSTHNETQFEQAAIDPAVDVVALGPIFATSSKKDAEPVVGTGLLRRLAKSTDKPVVAIGGVEPKNLPEVLATGVASVAVLGAVCRGPVGPAFGRLSQIAKANQGGAPS